MGKMLDAERVIDASRANPRFTAAYAKKAFREEEKSRRRSEPGTFGPAGRCRTLSPAEVDALRGKYDTKV